MTTTGIIITVIIIIVIGWMILMFNRLITYKNRTQEAWSDIDVQLKRRYNLIPNLVETVKGYAAHEKQVFENVTEARSRAMGAQGAGEKAKAENMLTDTLKSLFAVAENYPDLKANQNFLELQRELTDTENKIMAARRFYNGNVRDFNIIQEKFPSNMIASTLGFKKAEFFETESEIEREVPKVNF